jgi:hypothetical protein
LPAEKREGDDVANAAFDYWLSDPETSLSLGSNLISRIETFPAIVERLRDEPDKVVADLVALREASALRGSVSAGQVLTACTVADPSSMRIAVRGDVLSVPTPIKTFGESFGKASASSLKSIVYGKDTLSPLGQKPAKKVRPVDDADLAPAP